MIVCLSPLLHLDGSGALQSEPSKLCQEMMAAVKYVVIDEAVLRGPEQSFPCQCPCGILETVSSLGRGDGDSKSQGIPQIAERQEPSISSHAEGVCATSQFAFSEGLLRLLLRLNHGGIVIVRHPLSHVRQCATTPSTIEFCPEFELEWPGIGSM